MHGTEGEARHTRTTNRFQCSVCLQHMAHYARQENINMHPVDCTICSYNHFNLAEQPITVQTHTGPMTMTEEQLRDIVNGPITAVAPLTSAGLTPGVFRKSMMDLKIRPAAEVKIKPKPVLTIYDYCDVEED
jgi:hypothetical protein